MSEPTILTHTDEQGIATLTMNRPEMHNAFDDTFIADLTNGLRKLEADTSLRLVVLRSNGKSFSAGADLNWMKRMASYTREENLADANGLAELMRTLNFLKKPTIALVQGAAYGGGVGLVACCDIVISLRRATFCLSEVKLGIMPAVISPYVVDAIGARAARRYFQTAEAFDAAEANRLGLVHELVDTVEEMETVAGRISTALLNNGPAAMAEAKDLVSFVSRGSVDKTMISATADRIARVRASAEGQEGLAAFLEKRKPAWVNFIGA